MHECVQQCSLSPDGKHLAYAWTEAGGTAGINMLQVDTGQEHATQLEQDELPVDLAWQASTGRIIVVLQTPETLRCCAFSATAVSVRLRCFYVAWQADWARCFWSENGAQLVLQECSPPSPPFHIFSCWLVDVDCQRAVLLAEDRSR